ncbi:glycosyltransferase [Knoellia locipacati]|uniref:glycosyltransferase n=1 Tax=Knoellia locipacati TaxID=882824 RepID=UPI00384D5568
MRIAMLATSRHPIVEPYAGGQESHTALLARGLRRQGHHVRLYACAGSDPALADEIVPYVELPGLSEVAGLDYALPADFLDDHAAFTGAVGHLLEQRGVDVVHNQSLHFLPLALSGALSVPVVTTLHTPPLPWMEMGIALAGPLAAYVCVSLANSTGWTTLPAGPRIIHNGVEDDGGGPGEGGEHLVWTGRLTPEKGTDLAIRAARAAGRRLRIAGPVSDRGWFDEVVAPELDGDIEYVGHLSHAELATLVRGSAATFVTPRWDEPFGLVAAESVMWGTPVVALDRGGLSEFITADLGVMVDSDGDDDTLVHRLADAVPAATGLHRRDVHAAARAALGSQRMVDDYVALYRELLEAQGVRS